VCSRSEGRLVKIAHVAAEKDDVGALRNVLLMSVRAPTVDALHVPTKPLTRRCSMKKLLGLFAFAAILGIGMISLTYAAEPMAAPGDMSAPGSQAIKGDLLKIDGEFYVVKDASGKEVRLHVDKTSKLEGTFKAGDKIEAQASEKGHALSIKPADAAAGMSK
jgi:hypothetical protein